MMTRRGWIAASLSATAGPAQSIDERIRAMADAPPLSLTFPGGTAEACREWQQRFLNVLHKCLGPTPPPAKWSIASERVVNLPDHKRRELVLRAAGLPDLPVHLLLPNNGAKAGRHPGILALHGHGAFGHDSVAGIDTTEERRAAIAAANYDYGRQLVRRGYVVAAPCFTPFGVRLGDPKAYRGEDPCGVTFIRLQLFGKVLISENLRDSLWALELLAADPEVDATRLGCVGLSYGGRMSMLASAVSDRIRVAVCSGALNVMQERVRGRYSCGAQVIPGLLQYGDVPEIGSLIAPRPCLWEVGNKDGLMVQPWAGRAYERMQRAWAALGAADLLQIDRFEGAHRWNGEKAFPLLDQVLRPA